MQRKDVSRTRCTMNFQSNNVNFFSWNLVFQLGQGLTIICTKRGGDVFTNSLSNGLQTVTARPEAILFRFAPITSLLTGIPGSGYLSHAVNLYRRCKCSYEEDAIANLCLLHCFSCVVNASDIQQVHGGWNVKTP
jgi:hypothetical protein